ncbi:hypothetical protein [Nocardioides sp. 616]|uniref:hypothetical protein n=1 Tax=Nocardioides sp. 616 TaxID=2268090 RepID=UPI000CE4115A|nr:hypothetical protein [Nocardioides sp. 616]
MTAEERKRLKGAERALEHVAMYAHELHWDLKPDCEARLRERVEKVRPLRVVDDPADMDELNQP